jgi:hypothetical protein
MSNGSAQNRISLDKAKKMTRKFREQRERITIPGHTGDIIPICETFDRSGFDALLAQPGCTAVRIYYAMDEDLGLHAVIVGVDAENRDILPTATSSPTSLAATTEGTPGTASEEEPATGEEETGLILDEGLRCPPSCPPASDLNP